MVVRLAIQKGKKLMLVGAGKFQVPIIELT
jgi:hypothetical protein